MGTKSNFALRLPASLKTALEQVARDDGTTLNQLIVTAAAEKLAALKTAELFQQWSEHADRSTFDRLLDPSRGHAPSPDDQLPLGYTRRAARQN